MIPVETKKILDSKILLNGQSKALMKAQAGYLEPIYIAFPRTLDKK